MLLLSGRFLVFLSSRLAALFSGDNHAMPFPGKKCFGLDDRSEGLVLLIFQHLHPWNFFTWLHNR
jgi:hypothetical protein